MIHARARDRVRAALLVVVGIWLATALSWAFLPSTRLAIVLEDGVLENATALSLLAAAVIGFVRLAGASRKERLLYLALPVLALLGFLDEISFGARWLGFEVPEVDGTELDGIHDLAKIGAVHHYLSVVRWILLEKLAAPVAASMVLAGLGAAAWLVWRLRGWWAAHPPLAFLAVGVFVIGLGLLVDLELPRHLLLKLGEELLELTGGVLFVFGALSIRRSDPSSSQLQ